MPKRNTSTGRVLEQMVIPALKRGGYHYRRGVYIDHRPGGKEHKIDILAWRSKRPILISLKWQQVGGTTEEKIPFEIISLIEAISNWPQKKDVKIKCEEPECKEEFKFTKTKPVAHLVLGGEGWTLRDFYVKDNLKKYLRYPPLIKDLIKIIKLEKFIAITNQGKI